ncbi:hypothetical protein K491DRAFT_692475 [Lophiostoma macrostomum CBS 122681]|uniref:Uncharacterized protein n=1 Tax=Lophiostoma macrostomum CBS 122681 TaxID=1314788 RepID=A0A6A6T7J3_9PLEO|nr:hypothetical protein K491DRAFT_692475 [Lophiostoma macrostomum CBS 122681]
MTASAPHVLSDLSRQRQIHYIKREYYKYRPHTLQYLIIRYRLSPSRQEMGNSKSRRSPTPGSSCYFPKPICKSPYNRGISSTEICRCCRNYDTSLLRQWIRERGDHNNTALLTEIKDIEEERRKEVVEAKQAGKAICTFVDPAYYGTRWRRRFVPKHVGLCRRHTYPHAEFSRFACRSCGERFSSEEWFTSAFAVDVDSSFWRLKDDAAI